MCEKKEREREREGGGDKETQRYTDTERYSIHVLAIEERAEERGSERARERWGERIRHFFFFS